MTCDLGGEWLPRVTLAKENKNIPGKKKKQQLCPKSPVYPEKTNSERYMHSYVHSESESHSVMSKSLQPHELNSPWNSPGQNTGVGSLSLLQGIFPTQGSNPGPLPCKWILNQLSHQGSQRLLEWGACPFSSGFP